jgi:hypothetical protein
MSVMLRIKLDTKGAGMQRLNKAGMYPLTIENVKFHNKGLTLHLRGAYDFGEFYLKYKSNFDVAVINQLFSAIGCKLSLEESDNVERLIGKSADFLISRVDVDKCNGVNVFTMKIISVMPSPENFKQSNKYFRDVIKTITNRNSVLIFG